MIVSRVQACSCRMVWFQGRCWAAAGGRPPAASAVEAAGVAGCAGMGCGFSRQLRTIAQIGVVMHMHEGRKE